MNVLLVCSAGMSTSLLVNKMIDASKFQNRDDKITAIAQSELDNNLAAYDVVLLSPQMKFLFEKIQPKAEKLDKPIDIIPQKLYSKIDGKAVLELAQKLYKNN